MKCTFCESTIDEEAVFCPFCNARVPGAAALDDYDYEAFISYRHLERDRKVAKRLQRRLEGMRVPRGVTSYDGRRRLGKLFRDEDELPTASSLSDQIKDALKHSRRLIVICSPKTNESRWVQREVELYASYHGRENIRIALVEGEPDESFPKLLRSSLVVDHETGEIREQEEEPLAADLRSDERKRFNSESLRIAATLIGCGYDDLVQRLHARRMRIVAAATSAVAVVSTAFGSFSLWQQRQIERNYRQALANESQSLAVDASELLAHGDRMQAIQVALAALPQSSISNDRPLVPAAQLALEQALEVYPSFDLWRSCYSVGEVTDAYAWGRSGLQAMLTKRDTVVVTDVETGAQVSSFAVSGPDSVDAFDEYAYRSSTFRDLDFCGERLLVSTADRLQAFDPTTGELLWTLEAEGLDVRSDIARTDDGSRIAVCTVTQEFDERQEGFAYAVQALVVDVADGTVEHRYQSAPQFVDEQQVMSTLCVCHASFAPDGTRLATSFMGRVALFDLESGATSEAALTHPYATDLLFTDDALIALNSDGVFRYTSMELELAIDVFDDALAKRWSTTERPVFTLDAHASYGEPTTKIADVFDDDRGGQSLVVAAGRDVIVYGMDSGSEANRYSMESPVTTCIVSRGSHRIIIVTRDGSVSIKLPDVEQSEYFTSFWDQNIGATEDATVLVANHTAYLLAYDDDLSSYRAFRYSSLDLDRMPSFQEATDIKDAPIWSSRAGTVLLGFDGVTVEAYDTDDFGHLWTCRLSDTELADCPNQVSMTLTESSVYLCDPVEPAKRPIVCLSPETGEVVDSFVVGAGTAYEGISALEECEVDGAKCLVVRFGYEVALVDLSTHEIVRRMSCTQDDDTSAFHYEDDQLVYSDRWSIAADTVANDAILLLEERGIERRLELFSLTDGSLIEADVTSYAVSPTADADLCLVGDENGSALAVLCADGLLRLFDTHTWKLLWESGTVPATTQRILRFADDGRSLIVQDRSGSLMLVSAVDGDILRTSTTTLPPIVSCEASSQDEDLLLASYRYPSDSGSLSQHGLAAISIDEQTFGPQSDFPYGSFWSADASKVLVSDSGRYGTVERYTLDELIELGHETVDGHELTDAERQLYRIAG